MSDKETITLKKDTLWRGVIIVLAVLFVASLFTGGFRSFGGGNNGAVVNFGDSGNRGDSGNTAAASVDADDDPVLGDANAPVTIIEFSDYQCPFCRKFWTETLPQIKKEYIDTGKVKLVYRDFPLGFHPNAGPAAEAAECVREAGGSDEDYFRMHDKIFQEQNILDGGDPDRGPVASTIFEGWDTEVLKEWAEEIGYNIDECMDSGKYSDEVQKDLSDGSAAGVQGTPGFFINGRSLSGAQPYSIFRQMIEAELG